MFATGSNEFVTPKRDAVAGMSCVRPRAPLLEISRGLKSDSALMTAETKAASTSHFFAASTIVALNLVLNSGAAYRETIQTECSTGNLEADYWEYWDDTTNTWQPYTGGQSCYCGEQQVPATC